MEQFMVLSGTAIHAVVSPETVRTTIRSHFRRNQSNDINNTQLYSNYIPQTRTPKLLYMTASYTMDQIHFLQQSLESVRDICDSGWDITIHIQVANGLHYDHVKFKEIQEKMYCKFLSKNIPIVLEVYDRIGFGLNSRHRLVMQSYVNEFDYFVFAEEDMILTPSHLSSYLEATLKLKTYLPRTWLRYFIGFLRYERFIAIRFTIVSSTSCCYDAYVYNVRIKSFQFNSCLH